MDWQDQIARAPGLAVSDPHYQWAGTVEIVPGMDGARVVEVTLDKPQTLQWTVFLEYGVPSAGLFLDIPNTAWVEIGAGVTRARVNTRADLLGTYTGQVCATTLNIAVGSNQPFGTANVAPVRAVVLVGYAGALSRNFPASSNARGRSDAVPVLYAVRPTWRQGVTFANASNALGQAQVAFNFGRSALGNVITLEPGETFTMPGYCGGFNVNVQAGAKLTCLEW